MPQCVGESRAITTEDSKDRRSRRAHMGRKAKGNASIDQKREESAKSRLEEAGCA